MRRHAEGLVSAGHAFQHAVDYRSQRQLGVGVVADVDLTVQRLDGLAHVDLGLRHGKVGVADDLTQQKQAVGAFHQLCHFRESRHTHVGAHQRGVLVCQQAAAHETGDHRQPQAA